MTYLCLYSRYWSLGFQVSRNGYNNTKHMQDVIDRTLKAEIPIDAQYAVLAISNLLNRY